MRRTIVLILMLISGQSLASGLDIPYGFTANTPARASEVNANFDAVESAVDDNDSRIANLESLVLSMQNELAALQAENAQQQAAINAMQNNTVLALDGLLKLSSYDGYQTAVFEGVNLQILNGEDKSFNDAVINGLGNLIIGYNWDNVVLPGAFCSIGQYSNQNDCISNGGTWGMNQHSGSHNLILGTGNSYVSGGAIVAGKYNISNHGYASILGGSSNRVIDTDSVIVGGTQNLITQDDAVILGGKDNLVSGQYGTVSGGEDNVASGSYAAVTGGDSNEASGAHVSISGGFLNDAIASRSSITGGRENQTLQSYSSIHGGLDNIANSTYSAILGGEQNRTDGIYSSISGGFINYTGPGATWGSVTGGRENQSIGSTSTVSGGFNRDAVGLADWVAGTLFEDE